MTSIEIRNAIADKEAELQGIVSAAEADGKRSFTDEENEKQDAIFADIENLRSDLERAEKREALLKNKTKKETAPVPGLGKGVEAEKREMLKKFSLSESINKIQRGLSLDGVAKEMQEEASEELRSGGLGTASGVAIPASFMEKRDNYTAGTDAEGGYAVQTDVQPIIEALRPNPMVAQLGATVLNGLVGNLQFPREDNVPVPAMVAETGAASATPTNPFGVLNLSAKRLSAYTDVSMQVIAQTNPSIDAFIADSLRKSAETQIDYYAIQGTGASNQPTGILNTSGVTDITIGDAVPTWAQMVQFETEVADNNGLNGNLAYLTTPGMVGTLKTTAKDAGSGLFLAEGGQVNGYAIGRDTNVPTDGGAGSGHAIIFGDWSTVLLGYWGGLDITVDNLTQATSGNIRLVLNRWYDVGVKQPGKLAKCEDATTS